MSIWWRIKGGNMKDKNVIGEFWEYAESEDTKISDRGLSLFKPR
jgi:hypothetical protein